TLADFKGKVVLLNIWATWCGPCRKEMPALDRLQAALAGPDFEVVALSIDRGGMDAVRKFFADIGIRNLAMYLDSSGQALRTLSALGLPTTLLIDREGREIGRLIGPAEWDSPEMVEFVRCVVARSDAADQEKIRHPQWRRCAPGAALIFRRVARAATVNHDGGIDGCRQTDRGRRSAPDQAGAEPRSLLSRQSMGTPSARRRRAFGWHRAQLELAGGRGHRGHSYKHLAMPGDVRTRSVHAVPLQRKAIDGVA